MTLSLVKSPAAVNLVGNDILFKVNTDNRYSAAGVNAELILDWATGDAAGEKFNLSWGNNTVELTAAASPDASGLQYPAYVSGDLSVWKQSLVDYFKANYLLSEDYLIVYVSATQKVKLTAREKGSDYSLTLDADTSGVSATTNTAGVDITARDPYQLLCRVWDNGPNYIYPVLLGEDRLTPDDNGDVYFKIQDYFKSLITFDFEWPEGTASHILEVVGALKKFYIEYAETYDGIAKKLFSTSGTATYFIGGGLSQNTEAILNEDETTWWNQFLYKLDWLTYQPREIFVNQLQPVKLSALVWKSGVTSVKLKVKVYYTDGTSVNLAVETLSASQYDIVECILGYQKLGLGALSKEVNYYEVWLTDQDDNRLTISRYFYVDPAYYENEKVFIFQNSLGRPDVVRFTGVSETETEITRSEMELIRPDGFTWRTHQNNNFDNTETERIKFNSGWLNGLAKYPRQFADYLREFYLSPAIWELVNNRLYPVRITSKKHFVNKSDETMSYVEFEAERGYNDKYYTRDENIHPSQGWESKFEPEEFLNP